MRGCFFTRPPEPERVKANMSNMPAYGLPALLSRGVKVDIFCKAAPTNAGCPGQRHSDLRLRTSEQGGSRCGLCSAHSPPGLHTLVCTNSGVHQCNSCLATLHSLPRSGLISGSPRGAWAAARPPRYTQPRNPRQLQLILLILTSHAFLLVTAVNCFSFKLLEYGQTFRK